MKQMNTNHKPAIVIPAYRRGKALQLLLESINEAYYDCDDVDLLISLEFQPDEEVVQIAENFKFKFGCKQKIRNNEKLGLKNHILQCADLTKKYGSVILLEEDLIVSPAFYHYSIAALNHYDSDNNIAGISLYAQRFNETAQLPFEPMPSAEPVYFMQLTSSWGQAWTAEQWTDFNNWLKQRDESSNHKNPNVPDNVKNWPSESWKKLFNYYLADTGKYFVYPYQSLSSNNSHFDGENMNKVENLFQVPLLSTYMNNMYNYLPACCDAIVKYDMYMEPVGKFIEQVTGILSDDLEVDLYGTKPVELLKKKLFYVTSHKLSSSHKQYPLRLKPIELNLKLPLQDNDDGFFSLGSGSEAGRVIKSKYKYIHLNQYLSYNRMDTKRFIFGNILSSLKRKFS